MPKNFITIGSILLVAVVLSIPVISRAKHPVAQDTFQVSASFYPLAHFAEQIGGSHLKVTTIIPAGSEPHDYEPTAQDVVAIHNSQLFLFNGAGLDNWAERILPSLKLTTTVLRMSDHLPVIFTNSTNNQSEQSPPDPHFWLDPVLAEQEVSLIRDTMVELDPKNQLDYQQNAATYLGALAALDQDYRQGLASCQSQTVVTSHAALGYLGRRYGLDVIPIAGLSPDEEPSPARLAELASIVRNKHASVIYTETLASPKLANTLAEEVGVRTLVFNPLEGLTTDEVHSGRTYISVMQDNLTALKEGLGCQ